MNENTRTLLSVVCMCALIVTACYEEPEPVDLAQRDLEASYGEFLDVYCSCYRELFQGGQEECQRLDSVQPSSCARSALKDHREAAVDYLDCKRVTLDLGAECYRSCPADPVPCGDLIRFNFESCQAHAQLELMEALLRCP